MTYIDSHALLNIFINKLMPWYPKVASNLGRYVSVSSDKAGSTDYKIKFVEDGHTLTDAEQENISRMFYEVKAELNKKY